ncbi:MAG TPA: tripartite tricarboxylate transporter substrate-binding protein [Burkholderiaceae bacterium]|nr:tripartite tricarboxylate transporter substrate-binding protein [Burkholderiaceae bacterium]
MIDRRRFLAALIAAGAAPALCPRAALAQQYPTRPVRVLLGYAAGGGADAIARTLAQQLGERLGQNFVVDNRPGASSTIAADALAKAPADGYTLMAADSALLIASRAMARVSFDPIASFAPVASVATFPLAIAVNAEAPIRSLEEMAAAAKAGGKPLLYATSGIGTVHHLAMEHLQSLAGITMTHVPYRGAALIVPDLLSGQIPIAVLSATAAIPHVKAGRIRVIGLTSPAKLPDAEWRPIADWLPGFDASPRQFLIAPAGTPAPVLQRLEAAALGALQEPQVADIVLKQGALPAPASSAELAQILREELARWDKLIKQGNITLQ